ncbi:hypothetical protein L596_025203 [Steinernema carpocapsae]|uniref:Uncharacterized protein n=1 Tax=Steinernema carpocapsae TaxID=34508 RepID=A0A4U5M7Y4_STECR|nr:hypothetical protein L596_025203 [Steinernema carpocapsae]
MEVRSKERRESVAESRADAFTGTLMAKEANLEGSSQKIQVYLDTGASKTLIYKKLAEELRLEKKGEDTL